MFVIVGPQTGFEITGNGVGEHSAVKGGVWSEDRVDCTRIFFYPSSILEEGMGTIQLKGLVHYLVDMQLLLVLNMNKLKLAWC